VVKPRREGKTHVLMLVAGDTATATSATDDDDDDECLLA